MCRTLRRARGSEVILRRDLRLFRQCESQLSTRDCLSAETSPIGLQGSIEHFIKRGSASESGAQTPKSKQW
jgi:hypothetical protein